MILLIDNYDSFTYNLYQMLKEEGQEILVKRNDELTIQDINRLNPKGIILSPGPGNPHTAGICLQLVKEFSSRIPILGICLGHQVIGEAYGGIVKKARAVKHGKTSVITHLGEGIFQNVKNGITVMRYHSLLVDRTNLPECLEITAEAADDGAVMAVRHKDHQVIGLQFHPESIATEYGKEMVQNFVEMVNRRDIREKVPN
ncbi:anthranilate synthase component II [Peribacillus kribbensis]|uniref:anthranilate synthase component II n=1 Tax=Peribacillus kribbensis TaxID=356658 RepID=UPI00041B21B1|nr:aminodeoxychorismate/anthranilate synthase component II [Peribacillus kribbensis]